MVLLARLELVGVAATSSYILNLTARCIYVTLIRVCPPRRPASSQHSENNELVLIFASGLQLRPEFGAPKYEIVRRSLLETGQVALDSPAVEHPLAV